jgi:hypothetical protein
VEKLVKKVTAYVQNTAVEVDDINETWNKIKGGINEADEKVI